MKQVLGIIPARYESSRFPGKPLAMIQDKPMVQWVYERCANVFDSLFVATDDNRIQEEVIRFGGKAVMTSTDHKTGTDRCREALDIISTDLKQRYMHIVNIQGDEPLIKTEQLQELLDCLYEPGTDIATLIQPFNKEEDIEDPNLVKVVTDLQSRALYFSRAKIPYVRSSGGTGQSESTYYFKHIGLYAYTSEALNAITQLDPSPLETSESLEQLRWLENGFTIRTKISKYHSIGVDSPSDLDEINKLL